MALAARLSQAAVSFSDAVSLGYCLADTGPMLALTLALLLVSAGWLDRKGQE